MDICIACCDPVICLVFELDLAKCSIVYCSTTGDAKCI